MTTPGADDDDHPNAARAGRWLLLFALLATLALRWPLLDVPLERDEGEYAYIAWRMEQGDVPYRDAFDQKPPGVFAAYWVTFRVLGDSVWGLRFGLLLWTLGTVAAVYALGRRLAGPIAGGLAALAFGVASASPALLAHAANTELYMVLPLTLSALFLVRGLDRERATDWLLAGAFGMAAFWFKQVAATGGLFVLLAATVAPGRPGRRLRRCLWMGVGTLLACVPVVWAFLSADAWDAFVDAVFLHNLAYVQATNWSLGFASLTHALSTQLADSWALWLLALIALVHASTRRRALWPLAWSAFLFLGVCSGLFFREHYFIQWLPGLSLLAGLGGAALVRELGLHLGGRRGAALALPIAALCVAAPPALARLNLLRSGPVAIARTLYGSNPFPESQMIADWIERSSTPEDTVFILGSEPQLLYLSKRRSATRYIFTYPLTGGFADSEARQREALVDIEAADPRIIVHVRIPMSHLVAPGAPLPLFESIEERLASRYQLDAVLYQNEASGLFPMLEAERARRFVKLNAATLDDMASVSLYRRLDP